MLPIKLWADRIQGDACKKKNLDWDPLQKENRTLTHLHCAEGLDVCYQIKGLNQYVEIRKVWEYSDILHFFLIFCQWENFKISKFRDFWNFL